MGLMGHWKQATGFHFKLACGRRLWQTSFYDRVLRDDESRAFVAAYILNNPVRAGLTRTVGEYAFAWCVWGKEVGGARG